MCVRTESFIHSNTKPGIERLEQNSNEEVYVYVKGGSPPMSMSSDGISKSRFFPFQCCTRARTITINVTERHIAICALTILEMLARSYVFVFTRIIAAQHHHLRSFIAGSHLPFAFSCSYYLHLAWRKTKVANDEDVWISN